MFKKKKIVDSTPNPQLIPAPGLEDIIFANLTNNPHPNIQWYRKADIPERFHFTNNDVNFFFCVLFVFVPLPRPSPPPPKINRQLHDNEHFPLVCCDHNSKKLKEQREGVCKLFIC